MDQFVETSLAREVARQLSSPVRLKTWSLIVTVFGDAVLPRGGTIAAATLGEIMEIMGVEAGAMRTAVSRLAKDGWVERRRDGRTSHYQLAATREREFRQAAEKIYASKAGADRTAANWALVFDGGRSRNTAPASAIRLSRNWLLADPDCGKADLTGAMIYQGRFVQMPDWFQKLLAPQDEAEAMQHLIGVFSPIAKKLETRWQPEPLEALGLRCLLVHGWRRIALRLKGLPGELLPEDWPEAECRALVARLYRELIVSSENWLDQAGVGTGSTSRNGEFSARFS